MRRADRLFLLVQLLRAKGVVTAETLAAEVGVSKRTVYRDLRDLEDSGVPIEGEAGVGYRLQRGFELPPMTFTPDEIEALVLGARMVAAWGDPDLGTAARAALVKVEAVLPQALRPALGEAALFAIERPWSEDARQNLGILRSAIATRQKLHLVYVGGEGVSTERIICPVGLYFWGTKWTLAAWCELRGSYRNFRPDRIEALTALPDRWDADAGPSVDGFMDAMRTRHASG